MRIRAAALALITGALVCLAPVSAGAQQTSPPLESDVGCVGPGNPLPVVTAGNAFDSACYASPANTPFVIQFTNNDSFSHNLSIYEQKDGEALYVGAYVPRMSAANYEMPALPEGAFYYQCDIHPFMNGKFASGVDPTTPLEVAPAGDTRAPVGTFLKLKKVADGFTAPVFVTGAGDGSGRLFIVDQRGTITIVDDGDKRAEPFLDIGSKLVPPTPDYDERGLLGLAFHPDYEDNGRFFVWYNAPLRPGAPEGWNNTIHLSEFRVSADNPDVADPGSEKVLMAIDHPQANHNSGHIAFGPDGYLYAPLGDGGNANDVGLGHTVPQGNAQDLTNIFGDILRIDVDHTDPNKAYAIPDDNPYADGAGGAQPEIYANGFRNPYHLSFDAGGDHKLYVGDAGQDRYEEIDDVVRGGNYGWRVKEGTHCFDPASPAKEPDSCPDVGVNNTRLIDPVLDYNHTEILGSVVVGGYVYRGSKLPELYGQYIFGDYSRDRIKPDGVIFHAATSGPDAWNIREMQIELPGDNDKTPSFGKFVIAFGQDDSNELYVSLASFGGPKGAEAAVYRLESATPNPAAHVTLASNTDRDALFWLPLVVAVAGALALFGSGFAVRRS